jgi:transcriptional regulator with XRE-family HTH domain
MNLANRLKTLRQELGLSQHAFGSQGFVSAPGWIKIENGQRMPSEKLLEQLTKWLVEDKYLRAGAAAVLKEELVTLKYLGSPSSFVREMAKAHARTLPGGEALLAASSTRLKAARGRPRKHTPEGVALVAEAAGVYKTKRDRRSENGR